MTLTSGMPTRSSATCSSSATGVQTLDPQAADVGRWGPAAAAKLGLKRTASGAKQAIPRKAALAPPRPVRTGTMRAEGHTEVAHGLDQRKGADDHL